MNIVTGYRGEAHITSAQDRAGNQGSYGTGSYVLDVGDKLAAATASANEIRISDGAISHQGCIGVIEKGTYDSCSIANGSQGLNRIDRIVARYTRNPDTNVESLELVVIQGTAVSGTPSAPTYNTGDIQNGDSPVDMPLYQVRLTGVSVASVTREFDYVKTQAELQSDISTLNGNSQFKTVTSAFTGKNHGSVLRAFADNHVVYLYAKAAAGTKDLEEILTIPAQYREKSGGYAPLNVFYMNGEDASKICSAAVCGSIVQFRCTSALTGPGGVIIGGSWVYA